MLISTTIWIWHFPPAISIRFLLLSNGVEIPISQGNSLNLQNQSFSTIRIIREHGSMLFWSKIGTSIIHGCSTFHPRIKFPPSHFGSTIGELILVHPLRFFLSPYWMALSYSTVLLLSLENFQLFHIYYSFSTILVLHGLSSGTTSSLLMNQLPFQLLERLLRQNGGTHWKMMHPLM